MSRWVKSYAVPLDTLIKEKENTNRPVAARSAGTVGKWGKMGFTSTRTYTLKSLAATIKSPDQSPPPGEIRLTGATLPSEAVEPTEQVKPKKFFKSRNALPDLMIHTQIIHHLPRAPPSPIRSETSPPKRDKVLKIKAPKSPRERKKSISEKPKKKKKKKDEKKIKPEAPPTRRISRTRKIVNYNEEDEEGTETPIRDLILTETPEPETNEEQYDKSVSDSEAEEESEHEVDAVEDADTDADAAAEKGSEHENEEEEEPKQESEKAMEPPPIITRPAVIEHPPIVLRISKGTSRLISTDSEDVLNSPVHEQHPHHDSLASVKQITNDLSVAVLSDDSKPKHHKEKHSKLTQPAIIENSVENTTEVQPLEFTSEPINDESPSADESRPPRTIENESVKLESLKIVIKTDVLKTSLEKIERKKNKKHHKNASVKLVEHQFKTPSPQPGSENFDLYRTLAISPSERDFDSQSSILGSISSKETTQNQFAISVPEDNCVVRSRGSSDVTSDLETSQHSSLVAPPSDIESRLESMMDCDDEEPSNVVVPLIEGVGVSSCSATDVQATAQEPLTEDILKVLTGESDSLEGKDEGDEHVMKDDVLNDSSETAPENAVATGGPDIPPEVASANEAAVVENPVVADDVNEPVEASNADDIPALPEEEIPALPEEEIPALPEEETPALSEEETPAPPEEETPALPEEKAPAPPEEEPPTERVTRGRRTRKTAAPKPVQEQPAKPTGRTTRNANNNNYNTESSANLKAKKPSPPKPPIRSYTRKRKASPKSVPPVVTNDEAEEGAPSAEIDLDDSPLRSSKVRRASQQPAEEEKNKLFDEIKESTEKEYKIKNKLKRAWYERDAKNNHDQKHDLRQKTTKNNTVHNSVNNLSSTDSLQEIGGVNNNNRDCDTSSNSVEDKRSVKLVISTKKGSIFKSRSLVSDQENKKRHVYKHTWDAESEKETKSNVSDGKTTPSTTDTYTDFAEVEAPPKLSRVTRSNAGKFEDEKVTSVKCDKKAKEFYTVVRNVKTAHQIQEIGEYQEMDDDVEYILDVLQPHNPIPTRCLSAIQLASKCMTPAFRMHVRAHGIVTKFFKALKDARKDLSLSLCTASIMFVLSQDTLNMDLDRDSLELMMNLLETDTGSSLDEATFERNKQKVREICEELKAQGKATHLNMDNISSGTLAMETLLSMTSKRAGDWFKEELRELGGLEHIIKTICECCHQISDYVVNWTEILLDKLRTIERCLRVLECVTQTNEKNQQYILSYDDGNAVNTLVKLYKLCDSEIALYPTTDSTPKENPGVVIREALVPTLKLLINLTHPFNDDAKGSMILGVREGIFDTSFHILLQAPNYIPERCIFELSLLVLLFLINLTMYTVPNRNLIMQSHAPSDFGNQFDKVPAIKALIEYFYKCEETAKAVEKNTDEILDNPDKNSKITSQEEVDETVTKLIQKAGNHMEHTLQACYAGLLIGHLVSGSEENEAKIRSYLKDNNFTDIISVLEKYYNFMNLTAGSEANVVSHIKQTKKLIDDLKKRDLHSNAGIKDVDSNDSDKSSDQNKSTMATRSKPRVYKTYSQR